MARWSIQPTSCGNYRLEYYDTYGGHRHCGELRAPTSVANIVDWIVKHGHASPGDVIHAPGTVLVISRDRALA